MDLVHEKYMRRCLDLATLGLGEAAPNPLVGSVIIHNNVIIGEGYHEKHGQAHAEVNAIKSVKNQKLLKDSTLYVNLEPCAHYGKTPPCSDLIIKNKIPKVVIGCIDIYSEVAGKGVEKLNKAGIEVTVGVLKEEALHINRRFFTYHNKQRPYIILKWAQSVDGFMDIDRQKGNQGIFWITQPETKSLVHKWRSEEAGILVGRKTIENDKPQLNCREVEGKSPYRIIIDAELKSDLSIYQSNEEGILTYVFNKKTTDKNGLLNYIKLTDFSLKNMLKTIYKLNIQSIIIEGGKTTLQEFIDSDLWDEARILTGVNKIRTGKLAPQLKKEGLIKNYKFGQDSVELIIR